MERTGSGLGSWRGMLRYALLVLMATVASGCQGPDETTSIHVGRMNASFGSLKMTGGLHS